MDFDWFPGTGQTEADGIATAATFGQVQSENNWTAQEAKTVPRKNDKTWDEDEKIAKITEESVIMGYFESVEHAVAGDEEGARRAAAKTTKSAIIAGSAIGGNYVGGLAGAAIAAAGKTVGEYAEMGISNTFDKDNTTVEGTFQNLNGVEFVKRMAMDAALQGMTAASAAYRKPADRQLQDTSFDDRGKEVPRDTCRYAVGKGDGSDFRGRRGPNRFRNSRKAKFFSW